MSDAAAETTRPTRGVIGLLAAILGTVLMITGFLGGIDAALNGSGNGAALYTMLFIVGGILVVAAIVLAIVRLVQRRDWVLAIVALVVAFMPVLATIALWAVQRAAS